MIRSFYLFALVFITLLSAPGALRAQTCTVAFETGFGPTTVDIIADTPATAVVGLRGFCNMVPNVPTVVWCVYIAPTAEQDRDSSSFYVPASPDSRLAWSMTGGATSTVGIPTQRDGSTSPTTGSGCSGSNNGNCAVVQNFTLSYLPRQQQDRVRPGTYTSTFTVKTPYGPLPPNTTTAQHCSTPPSGTTPHSSTFTVTANVLTKCQLEGIGNIDFGTMGSVSAAVSGASNVRAFGNIGVRCTYETPYALSLDDGLNADSGVRRMKSGSNFLAYQLLQPGCGAAWTTSNVVNGIGTVVNAINNHQVCGQLVTPIAIAPPAGTYTDTVVITATF